MTDTTEQQQRRRRSLGLVVGKTRGMRTFVTRWLATLTRLHKARGELTTKAARHRFGAGRRFGTRSDTIRLGRSIGATLLLGSGWSVGRAQRRNGKGDTRCLLLLLVHVIVVFVVVVVGRKWDRVGRRILDATLESSNLGFEG